MSLFLMAQTRTNPDNADYYIKGYLSIEKGQDGRPVYKLSNIQSKGISFDDPGSMMLGEETTQEDVMFQFTHYSTDYVGGISTPLDFWRYDESISEWQPDVETRQGNAGVQEKRSMVLMLVLDCSSSLKSDFSLVQEAAVEFLKSLLDASNGKGNIKIGIVGFSKISETVFFPITSLNISSYYDMCNFINGRQVQNGTALYYAMDKAIDAMESYCATSIPVAEPLSSAIMVTFTDGLDQTSRDEDKGIYTADDYYTELQRKMQGKRFNGVPLQSKMRGVRGFDIASDAQLGKFRRIGESLADFKLLGNVSELGQEFKSIAQGLISEWSVLNCFVPNSFKGTVAWTYPTMVKKAFAADKPRKPKKKGKTFFGINVGLGLDGAISGGFDLAFPVKEHSGFGIYGSGGYNLSYEEPMAGGGLLALIGFNNGSALYLGGGYMYFFDANVDFRIGYKFKKGLYLFGESCIPYGPSLLHVGYFF